MGLEDAHTRDLDEHLSHYWLGGGDDADLANNALSAILDEVPTSLFVGARALQLLQRQELPPSLTPRIAVTEAAVSQLAHRARQIDALGDASTPAQALFQVLGDEADGLAVNEFDPVVLEKARDVQRQNGRAAAGAALLQCLGWENLPSIVRSGLGRAVAELKRRGDAFQANALFTAAGSGLVLGIKVRLSRTARITAFANISDEMRMQGEIAWHAAAPGSGADWQLEWPVQFDGQSIGLGLCVAALVARHELPPDPLLAATGQIDVNHAVCGVTGVPEKLAGAALSGVRRVVLPKANRDEAEQCDAAHDLDLIFVEEVDQIRSRVLADRGHPAQFNVDGLKRAARALAPLVHLDVTDEKEMVGFYRVRLSNTAGQGNFDIYPTGKITVGGPASVRVAGEALRKLVIPTPAERREQRTVTVANPGRQEELRRLLQHAGAEEVQTTNPYEVWRYHLVIGASDANVILYSSGRCSLPSGSAPAFDEISGFVDQVTGGIKAEARDLMPRSPTQLPQRREEVDERMAHIGTDEAGKGDYFGPLVSAAVFVDADTAQRLRELGVRDSKLLSDQRVRLMADEIRRVVRRGSSVTRVGPRRFNSLFDEMRREGKNLNTLLAWAHSRTIEDVLAAGFNPEFILVDKFADVRYVERKILADTKRSRVPILQFTKAESDVAVAAASILARDSFLRWIEETSAKLGVRIPKGAAPAVIVAARDIVSRLGSDALGEYVKLGFKTTQQVLAQ